MNDRSTLIIGDLHLHSNSDPEMVVDMSRLLRNRPASRLVINGDFFDLDQVAGEHQAGEGVYRAVKRVESILEIFKGVGACLRDWVTRGGEIVWLPGNHDAELCLTEVQLAICHHIGLRKDQIRFEAEAFRDDGLHIEHGHQHDPDNRFHPNTATAARKGRLSAFPLGSLTTRFLMCRIPVFTNHGDNYQTPGKVLHRVLQDYRWSVPRMVFLYAYSALRIARQAFLARRRRDAERRTTMFGPWRVLNRMYMDRVSMAAALLAIITLGLADLLGLSAYLPSMPSTAALAAGLPFATLLLLPPTRKRHFRYQDRQNCRRAANRLLAQGASVVVMGHTHHTERAAEESGTYINTGSFSDSGRNGRPFVVVENNTVRVDTLPPSL